MKIGSSNINMQSKRSYYSFDFKQQKTITMSKAKADRLTLDSEKSYVEQLDDYERQQKRESEKEAAQNLRNSLNQMLGYNKTAGNVYATSNERTIVSDEDAMMISLLKRILEALGTKRNKSLDDLVKHYSPNMDFTSNSASDNSGIGIVSNTNNTGDLGLIQDNQAFVDSFSRKVSVLTAVSGKHYEYENTSFQGEGTVVCADGRSISFNVGLEMSRSFSEEYNVLSSRTEILCDPLVINLEGNAPEISDVKFLFDLDCNGKKDNISFATGNSGFLALDKNGDGIINDGSELFGTKSGDGFRDLSQYDEDGNGWIDENDSIFDRLRIYSKDSDGNDRLVALGKAGVGAIYLGKNGTQFSLKDEDNNTKAVVRSTGVFLKENGEAGTIQHIDMAL